MPKRLYGCDTTEEILMNENFGNEYGKLRRFRINYVNEMGHSNIEGTIYLPAEHADVYDIGDKICELIKQAFEDIDKDRPLK